MEAACWAVVCGQVVALKISKQGSCPVANAGQSNVFEQIGRICAISSWNLMRMSAQELRHQ